MFKKIPLLFLMSIIAFSACGTLNVTVERTPLPSIPGVDATPTPPNIIGPGPTFTLPVQPLNMDSSPDIIQQKMLHSALNWTTIWLDGINTDLTVGGNSTAHEQLWFDQAGARFRFLSGPVDGEAQTLTVSDGSSKLSMDIQSEVKQMSAMPQGIAGQFVPQLTTSGTALPNPIGEQTSAWARNMVFSSYWAQSPSAGFKPVGMDRIAERQALVVDYDALGTRIWVDILTGIILKQQRFGEGGGSMVEEYVITKVLYDIPNLPVELFSVNPASRPVFSDVMGTPLVSVTPTPVPTTNNSEIYQVITRPNPLNNLLTDVYIQNISTQEEKLFITLDNVNTGNYHVGEYHNGNLYIIRRMGYPDENWSDELWRYDILGNGKMLFSKKGLDFRVAPNKNYAAVAYQSTEDNANKVAFISENGEVVQDINVDPTGHYLGNPNKWSDNNSLFWGELKLGPTPKYFYQISISFWSMTSYDITQLSIGDEYELNANTGKIVYSDYPSFFTEENRQQFLNSGREVKLFLYDLNSKNLQIIATSITKPFSPKWLDNFTIEYDDPNGGTRIKFEIKSESTQVIVFQPEGVPTQERTGSCSSTSNVLNRVDAWRCTADNSIYDPCFSIPGNSQAVICDTSPLSDSTGFKLNFTESLPARGTASPVKSAWEFELADGTNCTFMGGATAAFEGKRVNYTCSDGWSILGELQEGQVWTARKVRLSSDLSSIEESVQVFIKKVWL